MLQGQTDLNTLGADIRALRKARGLTLAELAQTLRALGRVVEPS
jgi:DNA-binding transcriptional regulator YiaG